jgi:hypothetical protein
MSRIDELKKQHPNYALSTIDIFKMISPNQSSKYVEMLIKLDKDKRFNDPDDYRRQIIECMVGWGIDYNYLETFDLETLHMFFINVNNLVGDTGKIRLFTKFASLNERKLIENNDITSYSTWEEMEQAVSLAEIKLIDKETAKQIKKIYEDDEWLSLRPLSLEASMKYGANTKWCTTTESGQYYARYSARGILIYNINKKTGYKVACFKNLSPDHDNEFSWWDVTDKKIEVLDSEAPAAVLEAIRNEIKTTTVSNQMLMTKAESDKLEAYKEGNKYRVEPIEEPRLHISGGLNYYPSIGTSTTLTFNPTTHTTTDTLRINSSGNVGIGTINPPTQLSITGDIEVRDGNIRMIDFNGAETMRITSNGETLVTAPDGRRYINGIIQQPEQPTQQYNHFEVRDEDTTRLIQALTRELNEGDRIAADAQQRLDDAMAEQLAEANERVAQKHLSLLENIEIGTVDQQMIERMQRLAGIETREMRIRKTEAELEQLRAEISREEEIAAEIETQREALKEDICSSVYEAEQPVVPSKHSWIDKIKSGYEKIKVYITRSKMAKGTK